VKRWKRINFTGDLRRYAGFFFCFLAAARRVTPVSHRRISRAVRPASTAAPSLITKNYATTLLGDGAVGRSGASIAAGPDNRRTPRIPLSVRPSVGDRRADGGVSFLLDLTRFHNLPSRSCGDKRIALSVGADVRPSPLNGPRLAEPAGAPSTSKQAIRFISLRIAVANCEWRAVDWPSTNEIYQERPCVRLWHIAPPLSRDHR